jgi:hypothetical protein
MMLSVHQFTLNVNPEATMTKSWSTIVEEDPADPETMILQFPDEMLAEVGWQAGDTLVWEIQEDQTVIIRKK